MAEPSLTVGGDELSPEHFDAAASALDDLTTQAGKHGSDPKHHIHLPGDASGSHHLLKSVLPHGEMEKFENKFHMGNYVIHRDTGEKEFEAMSIYVRLGMHLLYYGSEQAKALHWKKTQELLKDQSVKMGKQYDSPESKEHIPPFIESFNLGPSMPDMLESDPEKYATFNDFFARKLKPGARPVAEPDNDKVVSSPADCRLTAFPTVDLATRYWIKGYGFTIGRLLGSDDLAQTFGGGSVVIARLAPQDYHNWHSPINGTVKSVTEIPGAYYTVNPQAINEASTLDVFCENRRSVMVLERKETSAPVVVVAVGAMLVGSLKYNPEICEDQGDERPGTVRIGAEVTRGQNLGAFYYGGSTTIVLFPKGEIQLDEDLIRHSTEVNCETLMRVGWRIGASP